MLNSRAKFGALLVSVATSAGLTGCAPSLQAKSAGLIGCKSADVEISDEHLEWGSSHEWTASCHGKRYACSSFAAGEDAVQTACSPMSEGYDASPEPAAAPATTAAAPSSGSSAKMSDFTGTAQRSFNESRQLHVVNASFKFGAGIDLKLIGVPQAALGPIGVTLAGKSWKPNVNECTTLEVVVNGQPYTPSGLKASRRSDGGFVLDGRVDFQAFKGLGQTDAAFSLRVCKEQFDLSNRELQTLKKFLVMYSEIATQVQKGELPAKASEPMTEPASQPAAAPASDPFAL